MLTRMLIQGLFHRFNYDIELLPDVTIFTGPNGYGKTTILKAIDALINQDILFFDRLPFHRMEFETRESRIAIEKNDAGYFIQVDGEDAIPILHEELKTRIQALMSHPEFQEIAEGKWYAPHEDQVVPSSELFKSRKFTRARESLNQFTSHVRDTYFIRENRLLHPSLLYRRPNRRYRPVFREGGDQPPVHTIQHHADSLSRKLKLLLAEVSIKSQELDRDFPLTLFRESSEVSREDFSRGWSEIKETQKRLHKFGLSPIEGTEEPVYRDDTAKALKVFLDQTSKKLAYFERILNKLTLFDDLIRERAFVGKRLEVHPDFGFRFMTEDNQKLELEYLSSGEQQEVVLLYQLLFEVPEGALVLIDEPEISLHVVWQEVFIRDLLRIVKSGGFQALVATHSPQIVGAHVECEVDLQEIVERDMEDKHGSPR